MTFLPAGVPFTKRVFDLFTTVLILLILSPVLAVLALLVRLLIGSPVLFRQTRPGYQGQPFTLYKYRTMTEARDSQGELLPDEKRLTALGHFLRTSSLDELPEIFNILRGEMSLVGPRPLLMQYLDRYTPAQARRHEALPGLTGWAQIHGRNILSWEEKFRLDVWYVDNWSFRLDLKILAITLGKVVKREGISQEGHISAEVFMGTEKAEGHTGDQA
jgi:lipopolysaccharide/colanic/teichoic acid biosynthesis glycosyltransferase